MAKGNNYWIGVLALTIGLALLASLRETPAAEAAWQAAPKPQAAAAKPVEPLQVQETNVAGVVAEFVECKRKEGVLTLKIRFRNTSTQDVSFTVIDGRNYDDYYVTAESKKYFVLRDEEKTPLAVAADPFGTARASIRKGGVWIWWAKYPAPPPEVTKINYFTPLTVPFEDIPITDQ